MTIDSNELMIRWNYRGWLETLSAANAKFVTMRDATLGRLSADHMNIVIRHDIDGCRLIQDVWPLLCVEETLDIVSSTYLFAADDKPNIAEERKGFFFQRVHRKFRSLDQILNLQSRGFEFGLHVHVCQRAAKVDQAVDAEHALDILGADIAFLRKSGIELTTMCAHGFRWPDGSKPEYDNYSAEYDYSELRDPTILSQFHCLERASEHFTPITERIDAGALKNSTCRWIPRHVPFRWLHTKTNHDGLKAEPFLINDGDGTFKPISIAELAALSPDLKGCLVLMNVHPHHYPTGDFGPESRYKRIENSLALNEFDQARLKPFIGWMPSISNTPELDAIRYKGALNISELRDHGPFPRYSTEQFETLRSSFAAVAKRRTELVWYHELLRTPNEVIVWMLDELLPDSGRDQLKLVELCGGVGPVSALMAFHGIPGKNHLVTDVDESGLAIVDAFSKQFPELRGRRTQYQDAQHITLEPEFDVAVLSGWEGVNLPYDKTCREAAKALKADGMLLVTFLERCRMEAGGYERTPAMRLSKQRYNTISAPDMYLAMKEAGVSPICYLDHGYPVGRFPRHIMVGRKSAD